MTKQQLTNGWKLLWNDKELETELPCSVYSDLFKHGEIEDPFYRDNENELLPLSEEDYTYRLCFEADAELLGKPKIILKFDGVDTLADIYLNGEKLGETYNMHRVWEFEVKDILKKENILEVRLHSPMRYMREQIAEKGVLPCNTDTLDGFPYLRKSSCMSGWDWAPKLPDMGIFRQVALYGISYGRLTQVQVRQQHENGKVKLSVSAEIERVCLKDDEDGLWEKMDDTLPCRVTITSPAGEQIVREFMTESGCGEERVEIENPMLWWPTDTVSRTCIPCVWNC